MNLIGIMQVVFCLLILCSGAWAENDDIEALLLNEDQREVVFPGEPWEYPRLNFLTMKREIHQERKEFKDFTICFRLNVLFHKNNMVSTPITLRTDRYAKIVNPDTGQEFFNTDYVEARFGMYNAMLMNTFPEYPYEVIAASGIYMMWPEYEGGTLNANQWHSICLGFDVNQKIIYMVQNGRTLMNISQPEIWVEKNRGYDTSMIGPVQLKYPEKKFEDGFWPTHWNGFMISRSIQPFSGFLTDIHIFGQTLSTQDMHDITSCRLSKKGDMYSWDAHNWEHFSDELQEDKNTAVEYRIVKIPRKSLCKTTAKYTFFPDSYSFSEGLDVCRRFGGKLVDVSSSANTNAVVTFLGKNIKENPKYDDSISISTYTMYTDEKEFNVWRHRETDELPSDPLIWNVGEPNGGMAENCAQLLVQSSVGEDSKYIATFNDLTCSNPLPVACEDTGDLLFKLRGICKYSLIDTTYTMIEGDKNKKRFLAGNTGWSIFWENIGELWRLSNPKEENMYGLHTEFATYPIGKNYWSIINDTRCTYPNNEKVLLNLSPCNSTSFTCDDGTCIPMTGR